VALLKSGSPVAFPTDTIYALGVSVNDAVGVSRVFEIKQRPFSQALPVLLADSAEIGMVAREVPDIAVELMRSFWPGALTLVFKKTAAVSDIVTAGGDTVAVRVAAHPVAIEMVRRAEVPLVGTSANIHGRPNPLTALEVFDQIGAHVELIIDAGRLLGGVESTILDVSSDKIRIIRQGALARAELEKFCRIE